MIPASPVGSVSPLAALAVGPRGVSRRLAWGLALAGLSSLGLALTPEAVMASGPCGVESSTVAQDAIPDLSDSFAQDVCRILTMPTASRSESETFLDQVQPGSLLNHTSASAETMTLPSLWWNRDSIPLTLGRHRLVDAWVAYTIQDSGVQVVDVTINSQFWRALTMPQRYGVLTTFGSSAQEFGYHLRFFQSNGYSARMIGVFSCESTTNHTAALSADPRAYCLVTVDAPRITQLRRALQPQPTIQSASASEPMPSTEAAVTLTATENAASTQP